MNKATVKIGFSNVLRKAAVWVEQEQIEMKSKFETRYIKTIRTLVVLSCLLYTINVILVLKG
jgi:hypothetical protein